MLSHALIPPQVNFSHLTAKDYTEMYAVIKTVKKDQFEKLGLDPCLLEDELNKVCLKIGILGHLNSFEKKEMNYRR